MEVVPLAIQEEDEKMIKFLVNGVIHPSYDLVDMIGRDQNRAARIHREAFQRKTGRSLGGLPFDGFDYNSVKFSCEMPVGYVKIPVGFAGPLLLDGREYMVPLAITEGRVVSSTDRGCKAIYESGGASSALLRDDGITSTLVARFASALRAAELKFYLENPLNFDQLVVVFTPELYRPFIRLLSIKCMMAGKNLYVRFNCFTGDSMGSGVANLGAKNVLEYLRKNDFPDMDIIGSSGKFSSELQLNWIEGSGKSVVCEAIIKEDVVRKVLRTSVSALAELNTLENLAGSAVTGASGSSNARSNAHATNVVAAIFLATGQDPAQIAENSTCITMMEPVNDGKDLHVSVTMPSIGVVTVGGNGTSHASQSACLKLLGVTGVQREMEDILIGSQAKLLATIVAGSVLAAELSLMSAIAEEQFDEQPKQGHI